MADAPPTPGTGDPDPNPPDPPNTDTDPSLDDVRSALRKSHQDNATLRKQIKEFEDRDKSEVEKLQSDIAERDARLAELPRQIRADVVRFASAAASAGFVDPEDALLNLGDVDLADSDAVAKALTELADRKPHLVRPQTGPKPATKVPTRPHAPSGQPIGGGSDDPHATAKERAAEALRALSGSPQ